MKKIFFLFMILLPSALLAQVRNDYTPGMVLPARIDLKELSVPRAFIHNIEIKFSENTNRYCLKINHTITTGLHPLEVDSIMSVVWGNYDIKYKQDFVVQLLKDMHLPFKSGLIQSPDEDHTRWTDNGAYKGMMFEERTRTFSYEDVTHPLYGLMKHDDYMTFDHLDATDLVVHDHHIKSFMLVNKAYNPKDVRHKYVPKLYFMVRFEDMEDTDSYVVALSPDESIAVGRYLLGENTIFDKKVMLEYMLQNLKVESARESEEGWRFYTTKQTKSKSRRGLNIMDFINIFVPGAFSDEEIARFEALPVEQRRFITDIATGVALNNTPTMMDSFNSAQQAVIADHDNAR